MMEVKKIQTPFWVGMCFAIFEAQNKFMCFAIFEAQNKFMCFAIFEAQNKLTFHNLSEQNTSTAYQSKIQVQQRELITEILNTAANSLRNVI